jgi:hypothetical protein
MFNKETFVAEPMAYKTNNKMFRDSIAVDWDGTLVEEAWPEMGDWLPGAKDALHALAHLYTNVYIYTTRIAPVLPDGTSNEDAAKQIEKIQDMLKEAGIPSNVTLWLQPYKPPADYYIDNRAIPAPVQTGLDWNETIEVLYYMGFEHREEDIHPHDAMYRNLLWRLWHLHLKKREDYGSYDEPFANVLGAAEDLGLPSYLGAIIRKRDKDHRILKFIRKGEIRNESVMDSLLDCAAYCLIAIVLMWDYYGREV